MRSLKTQVKIFRRKKNLFLYLIYSHVLLFCLLMLKKHVIYLVKIKMVCYIKHFFHFYNLVFRLSKGLSDPYCEVSVIYIPGNPDDSNGPLSPPSSPSDIKRSPSLFSCASSSCMSIRNDFY
jgi:hypothetical protein